MTNQSDKKAALELAYAAREDLLGEYQLLREVYESNPVMSALATGVRALTACIALLEETEETLKLVRDHIKAGHEDWAIDAIRIALEGGDPRPVPEAQTGRPAK